jgi:ketosteroid isomerase-like protein
MVRSKLMVALVCATLIACTGGMTQRERLVEQEVLQNRLATWVRVLNNAQVDSLMAMYMPGPEVRVVMPDGQRHQGWEELDEQTRYFYRSINYMNFVMQDPSTVILNQDVAISSFRHSTDIVAAGGVRQPVSAGHVTLVWLKDPQDNVWKISLEHISNNSPAMN